MFLTGHQPMTSETTLGLRDLQYALRCDDRRALALRYDDGRAFCAALCAALR